MSLGRYALDGPTFGRLSVVSGVLLLLMTTAVASAQGKRDIGHDQMGVPLSSAHALARDMPMSSTAAFRFIEGTPYAHEGGETLVADLYLPKGMGPFPAALYLHGGGWSGGNRKQLRRQAAFMASHGVAGMAIEYRLDPKYHYPAPLHDAKEAVRWLRKHAAQYNIDPKRIAVVGSSAGGHLAALMGVTQGDSSLEGNGCCKRYSSAVQAVVAFNGIYDLAAMSGRPRMIKNFLGRPCESNPTVCKAASPINHVSNDEPPFLIMHGTADQTAPFAQAKAMVQMLRKSGDTADMFIAPGAPHTFWAQKRWYGPSRDAMQKFLDRWLTVQDKR